MIRHPPKSTLFPYPTLSQSRATKKGIEFLHDRLVDLRSFVERARREMAFIETTAAMAGNTIRNGNQVGLFMEDGVLVALDRKSTRLNSSHVRISYAVFCLKK